MESGELKMSATFEQKYSDVLEEFVEYCNKQPRTSRADHLDSLLTTFIHMKMERYR